jgi:hypothetical protein
MAYSCRLLTIGLAEMVLAAAKMAMIEICDFIKGTKGVTINQNNDRDKAKHDRGPKSDEKRNRGVFKV